MRVRFWTFMAIISFVAGCTSGIKSDSSAPAGTDKKQPTTAESKPRSVGVYSIAPITDYWLKKYNIAAQAGLERAARYSQYGSGSARVSNAINAVLRYDRRRGDYFYSETIEEIKRDDRSRDDFTGVWEIFRRHGVAVNTNYHDYYGGDFLWRVSGTYDFPKSTEQLFYSLYPNDLFTTPTLDIIDTDKMAGNVQSGHMAFLAPKSIEQYARPLGWTAEGLINAVAAHEATHYLNKLVIEALVGQSSPNGYFRDNLDELSEITPFIEFYHAGGVNEFLADAVAIQTSQSAANPDQVIGFFASRVLNRSDIFELVDAPEKSKRYPKIRKAPHYASGEFIYHLFEQEEQRRRQAGGSLPASIKDLKSQGRTDIDWKKEHWLPYLKFMLTPEFIEVVRQQYLLAFNNIRKELRLF